MRRLKMWIKDEKGQEAILRVSGLAAERKTQRLLPALGRYLAVNFSAPCLGLTLRLCPSSGPCEETLAALPGTASKPRQRVVPALEVLDLHPRHLLLFSASVPGAASFLPRKQHCSLTPLGSNASRSQLQGHIQPGCRVQDVPPFHLPPPTCEISFVFFVPELKECLDFKLNSYSLSHAHKISQKDRTLLTFSVHL